jgi:hypothetical protein
MVLSSFELVVLVYSIYLPVCVYYHRVIIVAATLSPGNLQFLNLDRIFLMHEDLILGYPWLATFEPQFNWRNSIIDTIHLPIVV